MTINDVIADQTGSDTGTILDNSPGTGSVIIAGAGTVVLGGANNYTGGTTVQGGTLSISAEQQYRQRQSRRSTAASRSTSPALLLSRMPSR